MASQVEQSDISFSQHISYICSRLLAYGLPMVFFLVATSFYLKTYDSAQVKITFTQIGTSVLLFIWLTKMVVEGRLPFSKKDLVFVAPFLAYLCWGLFTFLIAPYRAWPLEEALRRFFYIILALITIAEFRSDERMKRLWRWLLAAAFLAVGYGLVQYFDSRFFVGVTGIDPFIWRQAFSHRVFSTFGNPNFYGNFLVIITPITVALILKGKGSLARPFIIALLTLGLIYCVDHSSGIFSEFDESLKYVYAAGVLLFLVLITLTAVWKAGEGKGLSFFLLFFGILFLNLYSTETKGAWVGFVAAIAITMLIIFEYFLNPEETHIPIKLYLGYIVVLILLFAAMLLFMFNAFIVPLLNNEIEQVGFSVLWIPVAVSAVLALLMLLWIMKRPWNLKKVIYGLLMFFVLSMGGFVLYYAKSRLRSVSFRIFTWIATWEMTQTSPILGNGIGSFKVIYPAFRRPQIIVLEGKSNTETDHAEDEYLEVWQDEGIIGFGIFLWMAFTAIFCGMKQLRWYSRIRPPPDLRNKKKFLEAQKDPRSYEVLGILGAYGGALIHWGVDVSIRFVSSGIFSGLLPGLLVAYARNHEEHIREEPRLSYDSWIRFSWVIFWTVVFLGLRMEFVPQSLIQNGDTTLGKIILFCLLAGVLFFAIVEFLERGITASDQTSFVNFYPKHPNKFFGLKAVGFLGLVVSLVFGLNIFVNMFQADRHHNLAIFFSKQGIWRKEPSFKNRMIQLPPDIKKEYEEYGGALEHYEQVIKRNPGFPMAWYFTGNVYNDWGSQEMNRSNQLRSSDMKEAVRLREKALDIWNKSEEAYNGAKALGPNYVQVHHQMGLLDLKRAQQYREWGELGESQKHYELALASFYKYHLIDPVFVPNYHRIVEILILKKNFDEAIRLYQKALYYNDEVVLQIYPARRTTIISELETSLARVYFTKAADMAKDPFHPLLPEINLAMDAFKRAIDVQPDNVDAFKGMGRILSLMGRQQEAQEYLRKAYQIAPNDPELKRATNS